MRDWRGGTIAFLGLVAGGLIVFIVLTVEQDRAARSAAQAQAQAMAVADVGWDADGFYRVICRNGVKPVIELAERGAIKDVKCPKEPARLH